jgi:hypothetical protein
MASSAARTFWAIAVLALLGCPPDEPDEPVPDDDEIIPPVLPQIHVDKPARATFQPAGAEVEIAGHCIAGDAPLETFTINDESIALSGDGAFSHVHASVDGLNVLSMRVEDTDGERATEAMAYLYGPTAGPAQTLTDVAVIHASDDLLDDDDPDLDDIAALVEGMLDDPSTFSGLLTPMETEYILLTPTSMSVGASAVDITPSTGELTLSMTLNDLYVTFDAAGTGMWDWVSVSGEMWADPALLMMDVGLSASNGTVTATVQSVDVTLQDFELAVDYVPSFLEGYLSDAVEGYVEDSLQQTAEDMVGEFLAAFLQAFAVDIDFGEEHPVTLQLDLASLAVFSDGITMHFDGRTTAEVAFGMPDWAGSLLTEGDPPDVPFSDAPLNVVVDDDFLNQLFFTLWYAGAMSEWRFTALELAAMGSGDIPPPLGPVETVSVGLQLPLVMTGTDTEGFDFDLGAGEIHSTIVRPDGERFGFSTNLIGAASLMTLPDGTLSLTMDDRPAHLTLGVGVTEYPAQLDPGDLAALIRLVVPPMLGQANGAFPGFPLPETDLGELADLGYFHGKILVVTDLEMAITGEPGLWVQMEGGLSVQ